MTKTIKICDRCGKEVNQLYNMPRLIVEGSVVNLYSHKCEMCKKCAEEVCKRFNESAVEDRWMFKNSSK